MTPSGAATVVWSAENGTDFAIQASTGSPGQLLRTDRTLGHR